jgi:hypothetical protein
MNEPQVMVTREQADKRVAVSPVSPVVAFPEMAEMHERIRALQFDEFVDAAVKAAMTVADAKNPAC